MAAGIGQQVTGAVDSTLGPDYVRVRSRADLQRLINDSIVPKLIKQERIDEEMEAGGQVEDMEVGEREGDEVNMVDVVLKPALHDVSASSSSSQSDYEQEPLEAVRHLYEQREEERKAGGDGKGTEEPTQITGGNRKAKVLILDHNYHTVRGLRKRSTVGRVWSGPGRGVEGKEAGLVIDGDDRILFNSNSFSLDRLRNASRSFDGYKCITCSLSHDALIGCSGRPVVFALADQSFSANLPAGDGKDCIRILRVEDCTLREVTKEFLEIIGERRLVPGSVLLLGSLFQLALDGTAQYIEDWHHCQRWLKAELGNVVILPLIPIPMADIVDRATIRSLIEFFEWFQDLPDIESRLLADTRERFKAQYLGRIGVGGGWCDERQSFRLPLSLTGSGKTTYTSKLMGNRPEVIKGFSLEQERYWAGELVRDINSDFKLEMSTELVVHRKAEDLVREEEAGYRLTGLLVGASNATRLGAALEAKEVKVTCGAMPGWRLTSENSKELAVRAGMMTEDEVLILYCLDSASFVEVDDDMRSGPPKKGKDGRYHLRGKLTVVTGMQLDRMMENLEIILKGCGGRKVVLVTPTPRFWIPCCVKHIKGKIADMDEDRRRILRELGKLRRTIMGKVMSLRLSKSVYVLNPLEVLEANDGIEGIERIMLDQVHLMGPCYGKLADEVIRIAAEWHSGKRQRERGGEPEAKFQRTSILGGRGGRGGHRGSPWRGGRPGRGHW